ncbi:MAG TPA: hypothetical protein VFF88_05515 [Methylocella sp.]|nr:hypothetical protein [Methylocella sp.]
MSYAVFALGALLSLCGALAIHAGYGIIQVERGWAEVIAGAIAFSCGIVTIALGCILYRLTSLQAFLKAKPSAVSYAEEAEEGEEAPQPGRRAPAAAAAQVLPETAAAPHAGLRMWPQRAARSSLGSLRSTLKPRGAIAPMRSREPDSPFSRPPYAMTPQPQDQGVEEEEPSILPREPLPPSGADTKEPAPEPADRFEAPQFAAADEFQREEPQLAAREPLLAPEEKKPQEEAEASPAPGEPAGACEETEAQEEPRIAWPAETAALEAILREEFQLAAGAALRESVEQAGEAVEAEEPLPEAHAGAAEPSADETLSEEPAAGETALPPDFPPAIEPQVVSDERLAIVGRYESEGTSYVMYADGSIEARTQHAVFHFKSMAELKAFMESQAQNPTE